MSQAQTDPWIDDQLGFQTIATNLTNILTELPGSPIVSVSAPFGMGKTFFATRWANELSLSGQVAIYINAWETDYAANPVLAFLDAIRSSSEAVASPPSKASVEKRVKAAARIAAPALARSAVKIALRAGGYVLVGDKVDDLVEAALKGGTEEIEKLALEQLDAFGRQRLARRSFKEELTKLRSMLTGGDGAKKIFVLVDELDRCRPPYALEFLEAAKHLFDVEGYVFVFFNDHDQLLESASQLYGMKRSGEAYLTKFFMWDFWLPEPDRKKYAEFRFRNVLRKSAPDTPEQPLETFLRILAQFCSRKQLTLRMIGRAAFHTEMALAAHGSRPVSLNVPVAAAIVARQHDRSIFDNLTGQKMTFEEIRAYFGVDLEDQFVCSWLLFFSADFDLCLKSNLSPVFLERVERMRSSLYDNHDIDKRHPMGPLVRDLVEVVNHIR